MSGEQQILLSNLCPLSYFLKISYALEVNLDLFESFEVSSMLYELGAIKACIVYLSTPAQLTPQLLILDTRATPRHVHCARQVGIFTAFA